LKVPVLGLYGGADSGIPQDSVEKMRAALKTPAANRRLSSIPIRRTPFLPTTAPAIAS
jgi:dienelactone hydrolase